MSCAVVLSKTVSLTSSDLVWEGPSRLPSGVLLGVVLGSLSKLLLVGGFVLFICVLEHRYEFVINAIDQWGWTLLPLVCIYGL